MLTTSNDPTMIFVQLLSCERVVRLEDTDENTFRVLKHLFFIIDFINLSIAVTTKLEPHLCLVPKNQLFLSLEVKDSVAKTESDLFVFLLSHLCMTMSALPVIMFRNVL